jgi:hypothetical protein
MTNTQKNIWAGVGVGLLVAFGLWRLSSPLAPKTPTKPSSSESSENADTSAAHQTVQPPPGANEPLGKFRDIPALASQAIEFYGKVQDQDGVPLPGVEVTGRIATTTGFMSEKHERRTTTTGANGLFAFRGLTGSGLAIDLKKEGYNFESSNRTFLYSLITGVGRSRHNPDERSPVAYIMFKSQGAEPMFQYETHFSLQSDGSEVFVDLHSGKVVQQPSDLALSLVWPTPGKFGWRFRVRVIDGGIVAGASDQLYIAQLVGYEHSLEYSFGENEREKDSPREFYVRCRSGISHARINLFVQPGETKGRITLRTWLNPSGSRNLEYDPMKRINNPIKVNTR